MVELWEQIFAAMEIYSNQIPDPVKVSLVYRHQCLFRNRRYIYAFLQHRLNHIRQIRWDTAGAVLPENIRPLLSDRENDYFMEYNTILSEYCTSIGRNDIFENLEPPKELLIEIRVIKDCGEIMTDLGPVKLDAGTTHFLRRYVVVFLKNVFRFNCPIFVQIRCRVADSSGLGGALSKRIKLIYYLFLC